MNDFKIDRDIEKAFKTGLMKVAKINDTWIITGGIDNGVIKIVGEAVDGDADSHNLTVLGITCRSRIYGTYPSLMRFGEAPPTEENRHFLNQHHLSFIFVENTNNLNENEFRLRLEIFLKESLNIPYFLISVNGDFDTLEKIYRVLERKISILLVAVN